MSGDDHRRQMEQLQLGRAFDVLRRDGFWSLIHRLLSRLAYVHTQLLLECTLNERHETVHSPDLQFRWVNLPDLEQFPSLELLTSAAGRRDSTARLARGDRCAVGLYHGTPVTYLWVTFSVRELPNRRWPVAAGTVFVYKTFTLDAWRGHGFNRSAVSWALAQCAREGYRRAFVDVDRANEPSVRALQHAGFVTIGVFHICKFGPLTTTRIPRDLYSRVSGTT
jgi:GNAT superfamily N-acetyltransferase